MLVLLWIFFFCQSNSITFPTHGCHSDVMATAFYPKTTHDPVCSIECYTKSDINNDHWGICSHLYLNTARLQIFCHNAPSVAPTQYSDTDSLVAHCCFTTLTLCLVLLLKEQVTPATSGDNDSNTAYILTYFSEEKHIG